MVTREQGKAKDEVDIMFRSRVWTTQGTWNGDVSIQTQSGGYLRSDGDMFDNFSKHTDNEQCVLTNSMDQTGTGCFTYRINLIKWLWNENLHHSRQRDEEKLAGTALKNLLQA